jgi:hypothetical protein
MYQVLVDAIFSVVVSWIVVTFLKLREASPGPSPNVDLILAELGSDYRDELVGSFMRESKPAEEP